MRRQWAFAHGGASKVCGGADSRGGMPWGHSDPLDHYHCGLDSFDRCILSTAGVTRLGVAAPRRDVNTVSHGGHMASWAVPPYKAQVAIPLMPRQDGTTVSHGAHMTRTLAAHHDTTSTLYTKRVDQVVKHARPAQWGRSGAAG